MRKRLLTLGLVAAAAVSLAPPASANHIFACEPGFEIICTVSDTTERIVCRRWITC